MQLYRIGKCRYIDDTSGKGAALYGGRWNSVGTKVLYTAGSGALAMLEALVNLPNLKITDPYCLVVLEVPDASIKETKAADLPEGWNSFPAPEALRQTGDTFIKEGKYLILKVPSAIMPLEANYIINPLHPLFSKLKVVQKERLEFDKRLLK
jgi:RES domain-containing protein